VNEENAGNDLAATLKTATGLFAIFVAAVYVSGGLILGARLGLRELPSTAAVAQLPREFLVSFGLQAVGLPALVAAVVYAFLPARLQTSCFRRRLLAFALIGTLVTSAYLIAKEPFEAKACLVNGRSVSGFFIGEGSGRTYLGERGDTPRRVISLPSDGVQRLLVGGDANRASC
jgi:hypothetical protein